MTKQTTVNPDKISTGKKKYTEPTIRKVGSVKKLTLSGVDQPQADSGSFGSIAS